MDVNTAPAIPIPHAPSKSPEREAQTPSRKSIPSSNGVLKRTFLHHAPPVPVVYKECLKNHAAIIGGHSLDGCGEFLPAATATPADPTSLKCAACGCHRNFHRREPEEFPAVSPVIEYHPHHRHHPLPPTQTPHAPHTARESHSPPPISSSYMLLALSGGGGGAAQNHVMNSSGSGGPNSRKRFRTKFSQEQKEKMFELAEKVGWKMQKMNEDMVNGICSDIGVERGVFKVWMHNNKNTFAKRSAIDVSGGGSSADRNGVSKSEEENVINGGLTHHNHHLHLFNGKSNESNDNPANASSSSS